MVSFGSWIIAAAASTRVTTPVKTVPVQPGFHVARHGRRGEREDRHLHAEVTAERQWFTGTGQAPRNEGLASLRPRIVSGRALGKS